MKINNLCDSDFHDINNNNCTFYEDEDYCDMGADFLLSLAVNTNHGKEIGLNCPQCGCITNPKSLYDV